MQPVDFTTLVAACRDLQQQWIPARLEQVYQRDRHTIALALRTLKQRGWLTISWHPQAARICLGEAPPRTPDTFTFSEQLRHQLNGFALTALELAAPWERVVDLQFAQRPGESPAWHLYIEIIGKYSNVILTDAKKQIVTVGHQVTAAQSSIRTVETGQPYQLPPALTATAPSRTESQSRWQERISLIPGTLQRQLLQNYRGLSPAVARSLIAKANLTSEQVTGSLTNADWQRLFSAWQEWLKLLEAGEFQPAWTKTGYTVLGWDAQESVTSVQLLLEHYYGDRLNQQEFQQLREQLGQKIRNCLNKLHIKAANFQQRLRESDNADESRQQADLLMAYLQQAKPGMTEISLPDFETAVPVTIPLNPEKSAVQNAQALYKRHQKLKRSRTAIEPLLQEVSDEIAYLEQVEASISQIENYNYSADLQALREIREELRIQGYLKLPSYPSRNQETEFQPHRYHTPSGFEVWVGRNNRQNDQLTFRLASDHDLWFHVQENAGSHVLLRLPAGTVPETADLQCAADWAAYYSRARQGDHVPVVCVEPKYVYKPKGAKPGMVVYKRERLLWGRPPAATV